MQEQEYVSRVYVDDCVRRCKPPYEIGWVIKTHEQATSTDDVEDIMTGDKEADDTAIEEMMADPQRAPVLSGFARVSWIKESDFGDEFDNVAVDELEVLDRPFLLGDAVASAEDPGGDSGVIWEIRSSAEIKYVDHNGNQTTASINSSALESASKVCESDVAVHAQTGWIGFVKGAAYTVVLQSTTNSKASCWWSTLTFENCRSDSDEIPLIVNDPDPGLCIFYHGQTVCVDFSMLNSANFFPKEGDISNFKHHSDFVVKEVTITEVALEWSTTQPGVLPQAVPPEWVNFQDLLWLELQDSGHRLGDHVQILDEDLSSKMLNVHSSAQIVQTFTECRILWGRKGLAEPDFMNSKELVPRPPSSTKDFLPRTFVKSASDEEVEGQVGASRVVCSMSGIMTGTLADGTIEPSSPAVEKKSEKSIGIITKINHEQQTCGVRWLEWNESDQNHSGYNVEIEVNGRALSETIGFTVRIYNGTYTIAHVLESTPMWNKLFTGDQICSVNGTTISDCSMTATLGIFLPTNIPDLVSLKIYRSYDCKPQDLNFSENIVSIYDLQIDDAIFFVPGDTVLDIYCDLPAGENRDTAVEQLIEIGLTRQEISILSPQELASIKTAVANSKATNRDEAVITSNLASGGRTICDINWLGQVIEIQIDGYIVVRWMNGRYAKVLPTSLRLVSLEADNESANLSSESEGFVWNDMEMSADEAEEFDVEKSIEIDTIMETIPDNGILTNGVVSGNPCSQDEEEYDHISNVPTIAILDAVPMDHHFNSLGRSDVEGSVVHTELKKLRKGLPLDGTIFVRTYENRTDLLRIVIFGPLNTPYSYVPFFFDVHLPNGYPSVPPKMFYRSESANDRLNPNLYENGKVCLSLLGTWNGPGWDVKTSSLLQVIMSLQALVLVEEPYYNEPGYEKLKGTAEGSRNSRLYSENAFILGLQSLFAVFLYPPSGFSAVLKLYYKENGRFLLESTREKAAGDTGFSLTLRSRFVPRLSDLCNSA